MVTTTGVNPWLEITTNILDAAAFLLVTTELYGKERLEALRERILKVKLGPLDAFSFRKKVVIYKEPGRVSGWREVFLILAACIIGLGLFFVALLIVIFVVDWLLRGWADALRFLSQGVIDLLYVLIGTTLVFPVAAWLALLIGRVVLGVMLWLFDVFRIEGIMVVVGAIIFLGTRIGSIYAFAQELIHAHQ